MRTQKKKRELTVEQQQLMACLRAYVENRSLKEAYCCTREQWEQLYRIAAIHKMTAVVFDTLGRGAEFCRENPELKQRWRSDAIGQSIGQTTRTQRLLTILAELNRAQIPYALFKGFVCRQMYGKPDMRPSGDEDLLIHPEDRRRCEEALKGMGLVMVSHADEAEVVHWLDRRTSLHIELHSALIPSDWNMAEVLDPYLTQQLDRGYDLEAEGVRVRTLMPTAQMAFLVVHALKHFIAGGFGVRTMADVVVFAKTYDSEIDWAEVRDILEAVHGRVFLEQMLVMGEKYLGVEFWPRGWSRSRDRDEQPMLLDMLNAGIYGQSSMNRRHSAAVLVQYAQGSGRPSLRHAMFPPARALKGRYPELEKWPVLLPVAWARRMGHYTAEVLRKRGGESSPSEAVSLARRREDLMRYYRIFED